MKTRYKTLAVALGACALPSSTALADEQHTTPAAFAQSADQPITVINPPPQGVATDETYTTWNSSLFIGGAVILGASYGGAVIAASQSDNEADDRLYVPIVGPWLDLADRGSCDIQREACDNETTKKVLIVGDGILQAAGAFMMLDAVLFPTTVHRSATTAAIMKVKPIRVGQDGRGLAFRDTF